ncbi:hypothetical protein DIPPA_34295 [Diplonema papillatum]|nr:hypothetical protein DIPPA_34295 [Diplonema papillatum]
MQRKRPFGERTTEELLMESGLSREEIAEVLTGSGSSNSRARPEGKKEPSPAAFPLLARSKSAAGGPAMPPSGLARGVSRTPSASAAGLGCAADKGGKGAPIEPGRSTTPIPGPKGLKRAASQAPREPPAALPARNTRFSHGRQSRIVSPESPELVRGDEYAPSNPPTPGGGAGLAGAGIGRASQSRSVSPSLSNQPEPAPGKHVSFDRFRSGTDVAALLASMSTPGAPFPRASPPSDPFSPATHGSVSSPPGYSSGYACPQPSTGEYRTSASYPPQPAGYQQSANYGGYGYQPASEHNRPASYSPLAEYQGRESLAPGGYQGTEGFKPEAAELYRPASFSALAEYQGRESLAPGGYQGTEGYKPEAAERHRPASFSALAEYQGRESLAPGGYQGTEGYKPEAAEHHRPASFSALAENRGRESLAPGGYQGTEGYKPAAEHHSPAAYSPLAGYQGRQSLAPGGYQGLEGEYSRAEANLQTGGQSPALAEYHAVTAAPGDFPRVRAPVVEPRNNSAAAFPGGYQGLEGECGGALAEHHAAPGDFSRQPRARAPVVEPRNNTAAAEAALLRHLAPVPQDSPAAGGGGMPPALGCSSPGGADRWGTVEQEVPAAAGNPEGGMSDRLSRLLEEVKRRRVSEPRSPAAGERIDTENDHLNSEWQVSPLSRRSPSGSPPPGAASPHQGAGRSKTLQQLMDRARLMGKHNVSLLSCSPAVPVVARAGRDSAGRSGSVSGGARPSASLSDERTPPRVRRAIDNVRETSLPLAAGETAQSRALSPPHPDPLCYPTPASDLAPPPRLRQAILNASVPERQATPKPAAAFNRAPSVTDPTELTSYITALQHRAGVPTPGLQPAPSPGVREYILTPHDIARVSKSAAAWNLSSDEAAAAGGERDGEFSFAGYYQAARPAADAIIGTHQGGEVFWSSFADEWMRLLPSFLPDQPGPAARADDGLLKEFSSAAGDAGFAFKSGRLLAEGSRAPAAAYAQRGHAGARSVTALPAAAPRLAAAPVPLNPRSFSVENAAARTRSLSTLR